MIRVVLADDQEVVRMGPRVLVDREPDMEVVGEADNGRAALDRLRETCPDVLLLDIRMPGMDGLDTLSAINADNELSNTRVIVVTTFEIDEYVFRALQAGASGFLLKDAVPAELVRAVRVAAAGNALLSPVDNPACDRPVRRSTGQVRGAAARSRRADRAGAGTGGLGRHRPVERRDRRRTGRALTHFRARTAPERLGRITG